jgi:hypothetical protein
VPSLRKPTTNINSQPPLNRGLIFCRFCAVLVIITVSRRRSRCSLSSHKLNLISFSLYRPLSHLSGLSKSKANVCPIQSPSLTPSWRSTKSMRYRFWHRACRDSETFSMHQLNVSLRLNNREKLRITEQANTTLEGIGSSPMPRFSAIRPSQQKSSYLVRTFNLSLSVVVWTQVICVSNRWNFGRLLWRILVVMVWTLERTARPRKVNVKVALTGKVTNLVRGSHPPPIICYLMIIFSRAMRCNSCGWALIRLLSVRILIDEYRDLCWVRCIYFSNKEIHALACRVVSIRNSSIRKHVLCGYLDFLTEPSSLELHVRFTNLGEE